MVMRYSAFFAFALALGAAPLGAFAQSPAPMPAMDVSAVDCSTAADHMLSAMMPSDSAMAMVKSEDTDKAYADIMKMTVMHAAMASKIEMKCGKNAKAMAMAHKMEEQLDDNYLVVEALQHGY
jgi:hypothetical protein